MSEFLLQSWKEIAAYLRIHKSTAKRWAKEWGMPVCFIPGGKAAISTKMIDDWLIGAQKRRYEKNDELK